MKTSARGTKEASEVAVYMVTRSAIWSRAPRPPPHPPPQMVWEGPPSVVWVVVGLIGKHFFFYILAVPQRAARLVINNVDSVSSKIPLGLRVSLEEQVRSFRDHLPEREKVPCTKTRMALHAILEHGVMQQEVALWLHTHSRVLNSVQQTLNQKGQTLEYEP